MTLVQETHGTVQAGVLLYVPVYRPHLPTSTPDERMQALLGFVYSPYRVDDLMRGILRAADLRWRCTSTPAPTRRPSICCTPRVRHPPRQRALQRAAATRTVRAD